MTRELLLQAIARGWCAPLNANKEMDEALANSIADEVMEALSTISAQDNAAAVSGEVMVPVDVLKWAKAVAATKEKPHNFVRFREAKAAAMFIVGLAIHAGTQGKQ